MAAAIAAGARGGGRSEARGSWSRGRFAVDYSVVRRPDLAEPAATVNPARGSP